MSLTNLSVDGEFRYIIQWFSEWSELQRDDFIPVLIDYLTRSSDVNRDVVCVNGVVNSMSASGLHDKPLSLFQCRIKLFREWSSKWPIDFKQKLKEGICEIDPKVVDKMNEVNDENEQKTELIHENIDTETEINMAAVVLQETPVDEIEQIEISRETDTAAESFSSSIDPDENDISSNAVPVA